MAEAAVRFYAELNDLLPPARRGRAFRHRFGGRPAVKDTIEALGVPHTEVDLILVNGGSVAFTHRLQDGDRVSVYPVFQSLDISPLVRVRPRPLREPRFVVDVHLGRLAAYLRLLGFDTLYRNDYADETLARVSRGEGRILLSRDRGLLKRSLVTHGYCVRSTRPRQQLVEVLRRFDLAQAAVPFQRCMRCNTRLAPVGKEQIQERLRPATQELHEEFSACARCRRVYWKGTHYDQLRRLVTDVLTEAAR